MARRLSRAIAASCALGLLITVGASSASQAAPAPLTIAMVASETGLAAPQEADAAQGFLARIDLQNSRGGVNGHRLVPLIINDQTSPSQTTTAVQEAISRGAVGIVNATPLFYVADRFPQQAGIPVTGGSFDGPEWGEQPFTNMFASDVGSVDPRYPANTLIGQFLKAHGGSVIASYGYGVAPLSAHSAVTAADSFQRGGGRIGLVDQSVGFGAVDFTADALVAKQHHINAVYAGLENSSNVALITALQQAGVKVKAAVFPTGFQADVVHSPAWKSLQGSYFLVEWRPAQLPNGATQQLAAALQQYAHRPPSNFADFGVVEAWTGADLMIKGMQLAGSNPTSATIIKALRRVKAYNANGLLPVTINYTSVFGRGPIPFCEYFVQARANGFVPVSSGPLCGTSIPGTGLSVAAST